LHIFRHSTQIFLAGRQPACVKFMHSDEKSQLNFIELARDLTHRGCAVLPKMFTICERISYDKRVFASGLVLDTAFVSVCDSTQDYGIF
jgi:hypothetical protein